MTQRTTQAFRRAIGTVVTVTAVLSACTINNNPNSNDDTGGNGATLGTGGTASTAAANSGGRSPTDVSGTAVTSGGTGLGVAGGATSVGGSAAGVAGSSPLGVAGTGTVAMAGSSASAAGGSAGAVGTTGVGGNSLPAGGSIAASIAGAGGYVMATGGSASAVGTIAGAGGVVASLGGSTGTVGTVVGTGGVGGSGATTLDCTVPSAAGPTGAIVSTTTGGLWNDAATWVGGKVPSTTDSVVVVGEVQVNQVADSTPVTCAGLTITADGVVRSAAYETRTIVVNGDFVNYGSVRNGPNYASSDTATLEVHLGGRFFQMGTYGVSSTHFIGTQDQGIALASTSSLTGTFVDDNSSSALHACSTITSKGVTLTLGASDAQRGLLDMGDQTLTLAAGDFKTINGVLRASKIVGVAGATLNADKIAAVGTLTLDGDVRTDASTIDGSVKVLATGVFYNVAYLTPTVVIKGSLETNGIVRRGPGYAAYGEGDLTIELTGDLVQNGTYAPKATTLSGTAVQTITQGTGQVLTGPFTDTTPASAIVAGSNLNFGGATLELGGGTLDMGSKTLNLTAGAFKVTNGTVRASKLVGVAGATLSIPQITAADGTLVLDGDVRTDASVINGSIQVLATGVLYNVENAAPTLSIKGNIDNAGTIRRGPGFAAYGEGDLTIDLTGNLVQNGPYTPTSTVLSGAVAQTITVGASQSLSGTFTDSVPSSAIVAGSNWTVAGATFNLGDTGMIDMGTYSITHPSGELKIATGTLKANDITGGSDGTSTFTIAAITPNSGTLTVHQHYPSSSVTITGNLVLDAAAHFYNEYNVEARVTVTGAVSGTGTIGSGPGYASYDSGSVYLNGAKLPGW